MQDDVSTRSHREHELRCSPVQLLAIYGSLLAFWAGVAYVCWSVTS